MLDERSCDHDTFHIRAVPNEFHQRAADQKFTDTGKSSTLPFKFLLCEVDVARDEDVQDSQVGQPNQAVDKFRHQVFRGIRKSQIHREVPVSWHLVSFSSSGCRAHILDVGADGRVVYQIKTLIVQTVFQRNQFMWPGVIMGRGATGQAASLHVLPKKRQEHVAQMPTAHG